MDKALTRRSFVSAAAPAAVLAASSPALAASRHHGPDAELLSLADDFERLHDQWQALEQVSDRLQGSVGYEAALDATTDKLDELDVVANKMRALPVQTI